MSEGWFQVSNWIVDEALQRLRYASSGTVLLVLMRHMDRDGFCFPSRDRICAITGFAKQTVANAIADLADTGLIEKQRTGTRDGYRLLGLNSRPMNGLNSRPTEEVQRPRFCTSTDQILVSNGLESRPEGILTKKTKEQERIRASKNGAQSRNRAHKNRALESTGFDAFYAAYPRRRDPKRAGIAYDKAIRSLMADRGLSPTDAAGLILAAAQRYAVERRGEDSRFTKHPASWLNAGSYLDEPDPDSPQSETESFNDFMAKAREASHA